MIQYVRRACVYCAICMKYDGTDGTLVGVDCRRGTKAAVTAPRAGGDSSR